MSVIVFRGKRKDNGEWIEGELRRFKAHGWFVYTINNVEVDSNTIGQYSFRQDKNEKKIFVYDIIKFVDRMLHCSGIGRINLENRHHMIEGRYIDGEFEDCSVKMNVDSSGLEIEVIGNIFDNQDILENYSI